VRHASLRENKVVTFDPADFTISHREKIEWMLETNGWALEAVRPSVDDAQATPAHAYSIGVTALTGFPEILVVGLAPATANDVVSVAVDALKGGTDIPAGCELVGLLDGEQRCAFAPLSDEVATSWCPALEEFTTQSISVVQMLYPDRQGFLPYEAGYEQRMRYAQPVIGQM
jgi:hypothetical protein